MIRLYPALQNDKDALEFIRKVYMKSFPEDERREFFRVIELLAGNPLFHIVVLRNEREENVGFISYWEWEHLVYVEHFAVEERWRGSGYGAGALKSFLDEVKLPVVLEVEKPENEMSRRRIGFYERLGFKLWPQYLYIQPPYEKGKQSLELYLMTYGDINMETSFESVRDLLHAEVYQVGSIPD